MLYPLTVINLIKIASTLSSSGTSRFEFVTRLFDFRDILNLGKLVIKLTLNILRMIIICKLNLLLMAMASNSTTLDLQLCLFGRGLRVSV